MISKSLSRSRIFALVIFVSIILVLSSIVICVFIVLPNVPNSNGKFNVNNKSDPNLISFLLGLLASVALITLFIIGLCLCFSWNKKLSKDYSVSNPLDITTQISYRTDSKSGRPKQDRNCVFEPHRNYGYQSDETNTIKKSSSINTEGASSDLPNSPRSSFVEDLYKSFRSIQESRKSSSSNPPRNILESVDEEGYHFDIVEFSEGSDPEDIEIVDSDIKVLPPPLRRLDTFDRSIIEAQSERAQRVSLKSAIPEKESPTLGSTPIELPTVLRRSDTQESFKGIGSLKSFDNYLSLVRVDSVPTFLEYENKLPDKPNNEESAEAKVDLKPEHKPQES